MEDPDLLEIRIHGVRNTPAHEMLRVPAGNVCWGRGDASAGFSTIADPSAGEGQYPDSRPHHRIEAYSWGLLARKTGLPAMGKVGDAVVRTLWFGLAPFGLVNAAFWSRLNVLPEAHTSGTHENGKPRKQIAALGEAVNSARGTGAIRMLGLLLTLLLVATLASITMRADTSILFPRFRIAVSWNHGQSLAVAGGFCALAAVFLWLLPKLAKISFHGTPKLSPIPGGPPLGRAEASTPLARRYLWEIGSCTAGLAKNHLTTAFALISGLVAAMHLNSLTDVSWSVESPSGWWLIVGGAATGLLTLALVRSVFYHNPRVLDTAALVVAVTVLMAALLFSALGVSPSQSGDPFDMTLIALVLALMMTLGIIRIQCHSRAMHEDQRRNAGWNGTGPFIFGTLATGFALLLSFAMVQLADILLNVPAPRVMVLSSVGFVVLGAVGTAFVITELPTKGGPQDREFSDVEDSLQIDNWADADGWDRLRATERVWKSRRWTSLLRRAEWLAGFTAWLLFSSTLIFALLSLGWSVCVYGSQSQWCQSIAGAEPLVRVVGAVGLWMAMAVILALVLVSTKKEARPVALLWDLMCFLPVQGHPFGPPCYSVRVAPELADRIRDWLDGKADAYLPDGSCKAVPVDPDGATGTAKNRRVVIAAHSMGLVLTICTLFHARAAGMTDEQFKRIGILSYGVQVRRYFARFFPSILGPDVLSIVPAGPQDSSPGCRDPWPIHPWKGDEREARNSEIDDARVLDAENSAWALSSMIGNRWINLYRPNDPLGYGLHYVGGLSTDWDGSNPNLDRPAEEFVRDAYQFKVAGHSFYLQTDAYAKGIADVTALLNQKSGDT